MAGADIRRFSSDRRSTALTFVLGVAGGALLMLADTLIYPSLVLAVFVSRLTNSPLLIGLVPAISAGAWFLPQLFATSLIRRSRRQLPWAVGASLVRAATIVLLAYIGYRHDIGDSRRLRSFFICYIAYNLAAGLASIPATEIVAKAIPSDRRRLFFGQRNLWGGVLGFGAGLVARRVLGPEGPAFPRNFTFLFVAAAAATTAAAFFQMRMREPGRLAGARPPSLAGTLRHSPQAVADPNYRRFLVFRVLLTLSMIADPFYIIYVQRKLNAPTSFVGLYLAVLVLARLGSAALWGWIGGRGGHRAVLQSAALVRLSAPLVALIVPHLADTTLYRNRFDGNRPLIYAFGLVFAAYGAALSGQILSNFGYMLDIAPAELRPAYTSLANTILATVAFAPVAGGAIVDRRGYDTLFVAAAVIGLLAVFASGLLTDTHTRTRPVAQAWRLRGVRS